MSDEEKSTKPAEKAQVEKSGDRREGGGTRIRTVSEGYGITEEQEKTLLAGEDGEDLDVIECFVDDFDSDMEAEFRRNDAQIVELVEKKATETGNDEVNEDKVELLQVVRIKRPCEEGGSASEESVEPLKESEDKAPAPDAVSEDNDEDVIQIVVENADDLLDEVPAGGEKVEELPDISVSDDTENERILRKPLIKQVVMDVSVEDGVENELIDGHDGAGSSNRVEGDQAGTLTGAQEDSDAEHPLVIADSVEGDVGAMSGRHQEDPDVLQLKLDLHQNLGEMNYKPEYDDDDRQDNRQSEEERLERRIRIKEEPMSPVGDRLQRIMLDVEDIPTIVLSSDDDIYEFVPQKPKKEKKKSKKKSKKRTQSECSLIDVNPISVEESLPSVKSTTSSKSLNSNDSMAELLKTGFRMELRKRKSVTHVEENVYLPLTKRSSRTSIAQSKSRASVSEDVMPEKRQKTPSASKSTFKPISTADKLKINSLFADCEKPEVVPASILDDGMPLLDKDGDRVSEKAFEKPHQPVKRHVQTAPPPFPRQAMLINALPRATVKSGHMPGKEKAGTSKVTTEKVVPEIHQQAIQTLEDDLAMSSDEDLVLPKKVGSPAPKKRGRKRGRAPKQRIDEYFCPSPGSKKDAAETPDDDGNKLQVKRRKKRPRITSCSTNSENETTETISLAGTSSTLTTNRSGTINQEQLEETESALLKTDKLSVVLSPLTKEQIVERSKCITPKKVRALSKATQTELEGLTWRIDLNQIDFHSEYFEKLYQLISNGRELRNISRRSNSNRDFEGVVIVGREAVQPPTLPERSPQRPPPAVNSRARSDIEQLLFERADEVEYVPTARVDPSARERMDRSIRANFRIPKIAKQTSRSPQDVTSSTNHDIERQQHYRDNDTRRSTNGGYCNDRQVAPEPRPHITVGCRSPLRVENVFNNRPVVAAPAAAADAARPLVPIRRTIRNDNVQLPVVAPALPPVENDFAAYAPQPEQVQPPQYQANVFQPHPPPQQLGAYMPSGQDIDVKPNISTALNPQAAMFGSGMINRINDSFSLMCQLSIMQMMQQQHMQFPLMNVGGQMFPGPSVVPTVAAASNPMPVPVPPMPAQMMPPSGDQQDEVSDQISHFFGCIDHLKGRCIKNPCRYPHTPPSEATLRQMLLASTSDVVMTTYQFIVGQDSLFMRYFPVYADVMGRRNMRHQLINAVPHCEQSNRAFSYYRHIVDALSLTGTLSRAKAVQLVLDKHRKINFDQIHVLITLILDTGDDVAQFLPTLEQFSNVPNFHYEIQSVNRLLKFCVQSARSSNAPPVQGVLVDVVKFTFRLVMSVATGKETFVDTDTLLEYAELLIRSNLGLDHEKIMLKYRKNELSSSSSSAARR